MRRADLQEERSAAQRQGPVGGLTLGCTGYVCYERAPSADVR